MHYFVDAYNLLFRLGSQKPRPLEIKRSEVIESLNDLANDLKLNLTLVFDATKQKETQGSVRSHFDALEIIYTQNLTADDYILRELDLTSEKQQTVVTSDRELALRAKNLGAYVMTIDEFISWLVRKQQKQKKITRQLKYRDSDKQIERLLKIFEERLKSEE